ncbi:MAG TPA: tetratricopeptide repeat protein [Candidatus Peribacteraceae bacterium]|nr:tetratricopeptide repeat protein [Candidatus Peribacteraceae bacterium]
MEDLPFLPRPRVLLGVIAGFFVIGLLIYAGSLHDAFVRWDDGMLIYENAAIRHINGASLAWIFTHFDPELYIPLTFFTYQIEYAIVGTSPFLYHLDNLILHTLNALLVAWVLFLLLRRKWLALFFGLAFLVHPLNTEAVEWASARKDVLSTFFFLGSIISYLYASRGGRKFLYWLSVALFLFGLLSKVMVITLPVVLLLIDWAEGRLFARSIGVWHAKPLLNKIPYLALALILGVVSLFGKQSVIASSTLLEKILMAFKSTAFYIWHIFWPFGYSLLYPYTKAITLASPDFFLPAIFIVILLAVIVLCRKKLPLVSAGLLFYFTTVAPTLINFSKGDLDIYFASDRYAYVPQIGIFLAVGGFLLWVLDHINDAHIRRVSAASITVGGLMVAGLAVLAYRQSLVWQDTQSLFENVIKVYPDASYVAYNNLGNAYRLQNDLTTAIADYQKSIAIKPHPRTYTNLGAAYRKQKNYAAALDAYDKALKLDDKSPDAHFGLGIVYAEQGNFTGAQEEYQTALSLNPTRPQDIYVDLGALSAVQSQYQDAIANYHTAIGIDPYNPDAYYNLAVAEDSLGKTADAMKDYKTAIALDPMTIAARINLALLEYNAGDTADAVAQFKTVLQIDPQNASALSALRQIGEE